MSSPAATAPSSVNDVSTTPDDTDRRAVVDGLLRAPPASVGVDSGEILAMLDDFDAAGLEVHGMMLHRHGHVVAEGWRWPYRADRPRILHSATKSFVACAIGFAVDEGRLALSDKVVSFFPDELPEIVGDRLAAMTVEDLLTMRTGHAGETSGAVWRGIDTSWIAEFFKIPLVHAPGTTYVYTSAASYMLGAILMRVARQRLHDYLRPRLFQPLGIEDETWDIGPDGINPGGNGLTAKTADLLKLGVLHAQGGRWEGRQILPAWWVAEATRAHGGADSEYGYHWHIRPKEAYSALGIFSQAAIVWPATGTTLCITGAIDGSKRLFPHVDAHLRAAARDALPEDDAPAAAARDALLSGRLASWRTPRPLPGAPSSPVAAAVGGRVYAMEPNEQGILTLRLDFHSDRCDILVTDGGGSHGVSAGLSKWIEGTTTMPGRDLHHGYELRGATVVAGAGWVDDDTLAMEWIFAETAFRDTVVLRFDGDRVTFGRRVNINSGARSLPELKGAAGHATLDGAASS